MNHSKGTLAALALVVASAGAVVSGPAAATDGGMHTKECIYDYVMLTDQECRVFRMKILKARTPEARAAVHDEMDQLRNARARERGISPDDWRGLSVPPLAKR